MKFKIGDRVAVYNNAKRYINKIATIEGTEIRVYDADDNSPIIINYMIVHHKQCRRLIKKKKRCVWIWEEKNKGLDSLACLLREPNNTPNTGGKWIKFVESK